jgi:hypothetical protein
VKRAKTNALLKEMVCGGIGWRLLPLEKTATEKGKFNNT